MDIVIGSQFGDEGKGRIVDYLCASGKYDTCVRFNGSDNAGHTVSIGENKIAFNQVPIGSLYGMRCVIARGCMVDPERLDEEIRAIEDFLSARRMRKDWRLYIDSRCHVKTREHRERDAKEEKARSHPIGTTLSGNGPAYSDKYARVNQRFCDIYTSAYPHIREKALVFDTSTLDYGHSIVEGAHGIMLDIDHGTYPFVTSSACTAAAACHSIGVSPKIVDRIIGVAKPYLTRVGAGAMPTEMPKVEGDVMREAGHEYGTNTKRPRRMGWFDAPALRYAIRVAGITEIALCKTDVPRSLGRIKVCTHYRDASGILANNDLYSNAVPAYADMTWNGEGLGWLMELIGDLGAPVSLWTDDRFIVTTKKVEQVL